MTAQNTALISAAEKVKTRLLLSADLGAIRQTIRWLFRGQRVPNVNLRGQNERPCGVSSSQGATITEEALIRRDSPYCLTGAAG